MHRAWVVFVTWALMLAASLAVLWAVIGLGPIKGWMSVATFLAAIATTAAMALLAALGARRARRAPDGPPSPQAIPDFSFPTVLAAIALASMMLGLELGPWLVLIGAGTLLVALASVAVELQATRRAAARVAREERAG